MSNNWLDEPEMKLIQAMLDRAGVKKIPIVPSRAKRSTQPSFDAAAALFRPKSVEWVLKFYPGLVVPVTKHVASCRGDQQEPLKSKVEIDWRGDCVLILCNKCKHFIAKAEAKEGSEPWREWRNPPRKEPAVQRDRHPAGCKCFACSY